MTQSIKDLQIGGRNLLLNSEALSQFIVENATFVGWSNNIFTRLTGGKDYYGIYLDVTNVIGNRPYTFSVEISDLNSGGDIGIWAGSRSSGSIWSDYSRTNGLSNGRHSITFTTKPNRNRHSLIHNIKQRRYERQNYQKLSWKKATKALTGRQHQRILLPMLR
ncbi:MAG: hypothetical protein ACLUI7_07225 [Coprococcus sp.]